MNICVRIHIYVYGNTDEEKIEEALGTMITGWTEEEEEEEEQNLESWKTETC